LKEHIKDMKALKELENKENEYARQIEIYDTGVTQRKEAKLAEDIAKQQLALAERKAKLEAKAGGKARDKAFEDIKLKARAKAFKKGTKRYVENSKKNKQALISAHRKLEESRHKPEESEDESESDDETEEAEEQRYDEDNRLYTEVEFFDKYGDGGQKKWDEAPTKSDFEKEAERELEAMDVDALA